MISTCKKWTKEVDAIFNDYEHIKVLNGCSKKVKAHITSNTVLNQCLLATPYDSFYTALNDWTKISGEQGMDTVLIFNYKCNNNHTKNDMKDMAKELERAYYNFTI
jgi:hypothetical protein